MRVWEEWVVGWLVGWLDSNSRGKGVCGRGWGEGVQFRRPLWGLENSGIVPAGMQHQHRTCSLPLCDAQGSDEEREGIVSRINFNTSSNEVMRFKSGHCRYHHSTIIVRSLEG